MADVNDARLERLLRTTLRAETADLPVVVQPGDVLRRRQERRRVAARRRLPFRILSIAAAVALPIASLLALGQPEPEPASDQGAVIVRGLMGQADGSDYRGLEVILIDGAGREHGLLRLPASAFAPQGRRSHPDMTAPSYPKVSQDGWLAFDADSTMATTEGHVLIDLTHLQRQPTFLVGGGLIGWAPDGALWRYADQQYERFDPDQGGRSSVQAPASSTFSPWHPGTWALAVAGDGSGVVVEEPPDAAGFDAERSWGVMTLDTGDPIRRGLPGVAPGTGPRLLSMEHGLLQICDTDPNTGSYCPDLPRGTIVSGSTPDRPFRSWGSPREADSYVLDTSWAADGGVWKLVDRRADGRLLELVHVSFSEDERIAATFAADPLGSISIDALAPDDSQVAVGWLDDQGWRTALVDTRSGVTRSYRGQVAGFVPTDVAIDWAPGDFDVPAGAILRSTPGLDGRPYPTLPPVDGQLTETPDAVLLVQEGEPRIDARGEVVTTIVGAVHAETGYGISLVCSGPGDVTYVKVGDPPEYPVVKHCQDAFADEQAAPGQPAQDISIEVTADAATAWRIVIFDPPPPRARRGGSG